jgi:hydroxyacylglutathione hydrolase
MPLEVVTVPCLSDNYAYLLRDQGTGRVGLVDAPEHEPISAALAERGWGLDLILVTHHHHDHVAAVESLRAAHGARVAGAAEDRHRLPRLDLALADSEPVTLGDSAAQTIAVPGHTVGHVAYHFADARALFSADSLMLMGCGRLFEGTPEQMWASLERLARLPGETLVYSGHEYTQANIRFAMTLDQDNPGLQRRAAAVEARRREGRPTVPERLEVERATNPFLRPRDAAIRQAVGLADASEAEVFAEIRRRKDAF